MVTTAGQYGLKKLRHARGHEGRRRKRKVAATASVAAATAIGALAARRRDGQGGESRQRTILKVTTVRRTPDELYAYWRDLENFPAFTGHLDSVEPTGPTTSHWVAKAPAGGLVEWDAEIVRDSPGELIAWRSLAGAGIDNTGSVRFTPAPGDRGTEVAVELTFTPPIGAAGLAAAKIFGEEPSQQLADDLRRFKQVMETGEVVRSEASPAGAVSGKIVRQRPARPSP